MPKIEILVQALILSVSTAVLASGQDARPTILFTGETYTYNRSLQTQTQKSDEYYRASETPQNWTQKLTVTLLPYDEDPLDYAQAVKESADAYQLPQAKVQPGRSSNEAWVLFEQPPEFHIARITKRPGGLLLQEFTSRNTSQKTIQQSQGSWEKELRSAQWLVPPADLSMEEQWKNAVNSIRWYIHAPHVFVEKKLIEVPFTLAQRPKPPEHAWLYVRPSITLSPALVPVLLDAARVYRVTGLDLKKQPAINDQSLSQILESQSGWPLEPGWKTLIDGLRYLNIKGTQVTDQGAPVLARMLPLQVLILNDTITDRGLTTIATALVNLVKFRPGGSNITDRGLRSLSGLHKLHRLDLTDTSVTDRGLTALKGLPLIEIDLGGSVGDGALEILSSIPSLVHLELEKTHITDRGLTALQKFQKLHTLFIGAQLDDAGARTLSQIPSLRRLDVSGSRITDTGMLTLGALKDLEELGLSNTAVSDKGLAALQGMTHLRYLEVSGTQVTIAGLAGLKSLPALDVISLSYVGTLKLGDLRPLGALPALHTLILNGAPLEHDALDYIRGHAQARSSFWESLVYADAEPPLSDDTNVAQLTEKRSPIAMSDVGLRRIHDVESDLDHVIPDVEKPQIDSAEDTPQNFLGEFTVNATSSKK